jgi:hypothetical protein
MSDNREGGKITMRIPFYNESLAHLEKMIEMCVKDVSATCMINV